MAIDEAQTQHEGSPAGGTNHTPILIGVFVVLAALAVGEIYTLSQISSLRGSLDVQQAKMQKDQQDFMGRFSTHESSETQEHQALKSELDAKVKRVGSTGSEVRKTKEMVAELENTQKQQAEALKQEIARKADQEQLGALTQDVSVTKTDLDGAKKSVDSLRTDLGMTKSELGTLIARNHDDIETLRKIGERDYFEFTLDRKHPQQVAGIGLVLKKTNLKAHKYSIVLQADDMQIEKKDRTVNEAVFFTVGGSKKTYEMVVNKVQSDKITGYLSAPKGAVDVAATRSGGAQ
jgi:oligoendopeptidase F